ncbi:putative peptidyl-tRNA hydrolase 2 [Hyphodiscus hymeniophilus]|uniref:peptidyl-tRNA hydrolase n=1 Tax=Hyphodiscus hymeniophilus TaxID=353542 RepID=A0A9P6VEF3_9HELO|nr:putative peptidyl-tRNA hydrolase 2 [Hyphodiscus hymeniophilus]
MADRAPPTPVAMLIGTAIIAAVSGYMIGIASSLGFLPIPFMPKAPRARGVANYDDEEESEEEDIDESILDHAPNWANGVEADKRDGLRAAKQTEKVKETGTKHDWEDSTANEECKMVLVVRTDLGMTKGKIGAQCGHATLACYKTISRTDQAILRRWEHFGQTKIALQVKNEEELLTLQATARSLGVVAEVIADAGRTQIDPGSLTVLGIGPAPKSVINGITGSLKLLEIEALSIGVGRESIIGVDEV